jgi:hypothetical protein
MPKANVKTIHACLPSSSSRASKAYAADTTHRPMSARDARAVRADRTLTQGWLRLNVHNGLVRTDGPTA